MNLESLREQVWVPRLFRTRVFCAQQHGKSTRGIGCARTDANQRSVEERWL